MPLAFKSSSHGTVAFGFFNIDSDMLLLQHYFFFAAEFCETISGIAGMEGTGFLKTTFKVYTIDDPENIGDLHGAIRGAYYSGFIGEIYRTFPFPEKPEDFKQKPEGYKTRSAVESIIRKYGRPSEIAVAFGREGREVSIGEYVFSKNSFHELIRYVWQGGYPKWRNETRPDYVSAMKDKIVKSNHPVVKNMLFET